MDESDARLTWRQIELQQAMGACRARLNPDMRRQTAQWAAGAVVKTRAVAPMATQVDAHAPWLPGGASGPATHPERGRSGVRAILVGAACGRAGGQGWRREIMLYGNSTSSRR